MKFLSAGIENGLILEVKVKGEIIQPLSNIKGRLILDGTLLANVDLPVDTRTTYLLPVAPIAVSLGDVKNLRVQIQAPTAIGVYSLNSVYHIIDYSDIPIDYDSIRSKLGVLEDEVFDSELNMETTYLNSFKVFNEQLFLDRVTSSNINYLYSQYLILAAAISTVPTLLLRLAKKDATENGEFTRLANAGDLQDLLEALNGELQGILDLLDEYTADNLTSTAIFQFINISPDLITGT